MPCFFLLENYHCESTPAEKCFNAFAVRRNSTATPVEEHHFFVPCSDQIYKKDSYYGALAQALIQQKQLSDNPEETIGTFHDHLPTFKFKKWESFVHANREQINAFKLSRFLKERWSLLESAEKLENLADVGKIIHLVEESYPKQKKHLEQALKIVFNDILDLQQGNREENVRETIKAHLRAKRWEELNHYIATLDTSGFSYELLMQINEARLNAEEGLLWLQRREILDKLWEKSAQQLPDVFYRQYREARQEVRGLVERQKEMADREAAEEIQARIQRLCTQVFEKIKEWKKSPEVKLQQLKLWEDEWRVLNYQKSGDWGTFELDLGHSLVKTFAGDFFLAIKKGNTISEIKLAIEQVVHDATNVGMQKTLEEYPLDGQEETILEIRQHLDEWIEFDRNLERFFTATDPFNTTITLDHLPEDLERVTGMTRLNAVFGIIRKKYRSAVEVIHFIQAHVQLLENIMTSIKKETKGILYNKPILKLEVYERQFRAIEEKIRQLLERNEPHYHFPLLENFGKIITVIVSMLFSSKKNRESQIENTPFAPNRFFTSIMDAISCGEELIRDLKQIKPGIKSSSGENSMAVLENFFLVIGRYRDKEFLIPLSKASELSELHESLMEVMHDRIESYIKPASTALSFPFPLLETKVLEGLSVRIGSLLRQLEKIETSYSGFEQLVEPYKDVLKLLNHIMEIHELVRQNRFEEASRIVEVSVFDPEVRYPARVLVYYYQHLFQQKWQEGEWMNFFKRFSQDSLKANESGYKLLLNHYRKDARKNFQHFSLSFMDIHSRVFKTFFASDDLIPYLAYLCQQLDIKTFFKELGRGTVRAEFLKGLVYLLEKNQEWKKYIALYNLAPAKYKNYFEKPVNRVLENLEARYKDLVTIFSAGHLQRTEIDVYLDRIPDDKDFFEYFEKSKRLRELFDSFNEIAVNFKNFESQDIWMQDDFYGKMYESLGRLADKFTGDFSRVREVYRWEARLAALRNIYDLGRELRENMDKLMQTDTAFKIKAEETYSQAFRDSINDLLATWNRFSDEIAQMAENAVFKNTFQHYYLEYFVALWQKTSLYPLYQKANMETPRSLEKYFEMWEKIVKNHQRFLNYYDKKDDLQRNGMDDVEVLDEFIRLTLERFKQQGKL